jgi:hypothetical protein
MDYTQDYENSLHYSGKFQTYAKNLANQLIKRYRLKNKLLIEIGSGKGDFLKLLCENRRNKGIGFDASYVPDGENYPNITFIQDYYSGKYAHYQADFICCRQTLEHIPLPKDFIKTIRNALNGKQIPIFFEVPSGNYMIGNFTFWDVIYEHVSYFTTRSLRYLFEFYDFKVVEITDEFGGQYLGIHLMSGKNNSNNNLDPKADVDLLKVEQFVNVAMEKLTKWQTKIEKLKTKAVIWGAGSKGVTFLNLVDKGEKIKYAIDLNPRKQQKYIPGTGQKVVSPEFLKNYQPVEIIIMNPIYVDEIKRQCKELKINAIFSLV